MDLPHFILVKNLREHSKLTDDDIAGVRQLSYVVRQFGPGEDVIRQGDAPKAAAIVLSGTLARYHLLATGRRQYISFHMIGDMPDAQGIFIDQMDHSLCALDTAVVAFIPHPDLIRLFKAKPAVSFAIWRETLIDAAIFREAVTNNSARPALARMAHLFCEIYYRARASKIVKQNRVAFPLSLPQLGEALGMAIATVNRTLVELRAEGCADFRDQTLVVTNWEALAKLGWFDPLYLHVKKIPPL